MSYYEDSKSLNFQEIKKKNFSYLKKNSLFKGYNSNAIWIKIEMQNKSTHDIHKILSFANPTLDYIDFYDNDILKIKTGDHRKNANKEILDIYFSFNSDIKKQSEKIYYFKLKTKNSFIINIYIEDKNAYLLKSDQAKMFLLFFFGFILSIILYNTFLFFTVRESIYFYYVIFQLSTLILLLSLSGLGYYTLWKDNSYLNELIVMCFDDLSLILALLFTKKFLNTKKIFPRLNKLIYLVLFLSVYIMVTPWEYHSFLVKPVMMLNLILIYFISFYSLVKKVKGARFFFFAWLILMFGSLLTLLKNFGLLEVNFFTTWSIYLGSMLEALIFSMALAYRIKKLKKDKIAALEISTDILNKKVQLKTKTLNSLIKQKEVLIKEINHRVKNNLQIIVSFITILSVKEKDTQVQENYLTLHNRIQAIASLHEFFYQHEESGFVNIHNYFTDFIKSLTYLKPQNKTIDYDLQFCDEEIDFSRLTIIGIILNELITNSMKHAFNQTNSGIIQISLIKNHHNFILQYKDDGVGFDLDKVGFTSLGLKLVHKIATKQLNAQMDFENKNGSCFTFTF